MTATETALRGDLRARPDGGFDGWCWAPDRPQARLMVDLLANDRPVMAMVAGMFRRDVLALGCGDGRHGFLMRVPPHLLPPHEECLITARERQSGAVFGRVLRTAPGLRPPGAARAAAAAAEMAALWRTMEDCRTQLAAPPLSARLHAAFGDLGRRCAARAQGTREWRATLPALAAPVLTLVLPAPTAAGARRRIEALASALEPAGAELLLLDPGHDPDVALLPAVTRNLLYLRDPSSGEPAAALRLAASVGRGRMLALLDPRAEPSAAALLALGRAAAAAADTLLLAAPAAAAAAALVPSVPTAAPLRLPAALGLLIGGPRDLWPRVGAALAVPGDDGTLAAADLALRGRLLGHAWRIVTEPPCPATAPPAAAHRQAVREMHARWGMAA